MIIDEFRTTSFTWLCILLGVDFASERVETGIKIYDYYPLNTRPTNRNLVFQQRRTSCGGRI